MHAVNREEKLSRRVDLLGEFNRLLREAVREKGITRRSSKYKKLIRR